MFRTTDVHNNRFYSSVVNSVLFSHMQDMCAHKKVVNDEKVR